MSDDKAKIRTFETGATRNLSDDKLGYEGFLSPVALQRYAQYMHSHRKQADGSMRDADNWQQGIPLESFMDSGWRHFMDVWLNHRGFPAEEDLETALCALMFNIHGMLHEVVKARIQGDEQTKVTLRHLHSLAEHGMTPIQFDSQRVDDEAESRLP